MAHDKAYLICENKCLVEGVPREEFSPYEEIVVTDAEAEIGSITHVGLNLIRCKRNAGCYLTIGPNKRYYGIAIRLSETMPLIGNSETTAQRFCSIPDDGLVIILRTKL